MAATAELSIGCFAWRASAVLANDPLRQFGIAEPPGRDPAGHGRGAARAELVAFRSSAIRATVRPKAVRINCDTPTSPGRCRGIQWDWKEAVFPALDQYNGPRTRGWSTSGAIIVSRCSQGHVHFAHVADDAGREDIGHHRLSAHTAQAAGSPPMRSVWSDIGWSRRCFVDLRTA